MERHSAFERRQKLLEAVENGEAQLGQTTYKAAKNKIEKTREIDRSHLSLQQFENFCKWSTRKDRRRKLWKTLEITLGEPIFGES